MEKLFAKSGPEWTSLLDHTEHVVESTLTFAEYLKLNKELAKHGAILHDLGKAHPFFQKRLQGRAKRDKIFRHEIASLFFLSLFPKDEWDVLIEMVAGHHKSVRNDKNRLGLLDLEAEEDYIDFHLGNWDEWSIKILIILNHFHITEKVPSRDEALNNLDYAIRYCEKTCNERGISIWRGLLMGGDHFASAQICKTHEKLKSLFKIPDLSFYNRKSTLYPLSLVDAAIEKRHTLVVAPTGAGKTDFLLRRCKGRIFYTLPFQASINAMYKRIGEDLEASNPDIDIRVIHSSSRIVKRKDDDDTSLQRLMGASISVLTPHQLAALIFGQKGYESLLLDIKGCDVILDEVHTYSGISQALILKLIEVLEINECRIHVGTATMPKILYSEIKDLLGDNLLEVQLSKEELKTFNRHTIHKLKTFEDIWPLLNTVIENKQKALIVLNKVADAQLLYNEIIENYNQVDKLLLHSRFKRGDRNDKERLLMGIDEDGNSIMRFNTSEDACIVVSTQVVEVSLDISFDIMFTQTAPIDALIQRFGRINRERSSETIGRYKDIYIIAPPDKEKDVRPYDLEIIKRSFDVIPDDSLLQEVELQGKIDEVFTNLDLLSIEEHCIFQKDEGITIDKLTHIGESILMKLLDIDSAVCIKESDRDEYENGDLKTRTMLEIPTYYYTVNKMEQSQKGNKPFIIPDIAYDEDLGLDVSKVKVENLNVLNRFL